jgi:YbbR domain-containing protein
MIGFFKRYVLHNFVLKFLSVILAVGLWLVISPDERPAEVAVRAPIVFQNVPYDMEISSEAIPEAQIRVRGPERLIRQIKSNDVHAEIELGGVKPGERTFDLTSEQVRHPRELVVVQVVPSQVHLAFDTRLNRDVEIHPRVVGTFMAGDQVSRIEVDPPKITISGPRQHVEKVESATTDPIDATGTMTRATFVTNVYVSDPLVQVPRPVPIHVTVYVEKIGAAH